MLDRIKQLCKENNTTITALNETFGWSPNAIGRWDKNKPSIDKVLLVADYFGVSVDYLLGRTEIKETASNGGLPEDVTNIIRLMRSDPRLKAFVLQQIQTYRTLLADPAIKTTETQ